MITESTAWDLIRSVHPGHSAAPLPLRVHHDPSPGVWLQVLSTEVWETSEPVSPEARQLLDLFLPLQLQPNLTIGQTGQSLDGRIATETGHSHYVTGAADIRRLHRLRALVDAVVVGAGTVAADNPRLTVRQVEGDNPVRVVLDPDGRLDRSRHIFSDGATRTIEIRRATGSHPALVSDTVVRLPVDDRRQGHEFDPRVILRTLRELGLRRILVEGGGLTVSRFVEAGVLDRFHVTVAPLLIGSGRPALTLEPIVSLSEALRPPCRHFCLGDDVLFDLDLRPDRAPGRG